MDFPSSVLAFHNTPPLTPSPTRVVHHSHNAAPTPATPPPPIVGYFTWAGPAQRKYLHFVGYILVAQAGLRPRWASQPLRTFTNQHISQESLCLI